MRRDTKLNFNDKQLEQAVTDVVRLSGTTNIVGQLSVVSGGSFNFKDGNEASGKVFVSDANGNASWQTISNNDAGGDDTSIQFNNNGLLSGTTGFTWNQSSSLLKINGSLQLIDGNQGIGKILTSDANGNASWSDFDSGGDWDILINIPAWLSATTLNAFQTGHTHSYNNLTNLPNLNIYGRLASANVWSAGNNFTGGLCSNGYIVWHSGNDGGGSGLDAGLLSGQTPSYYLNYSNFTNKPDIPSILDDLDNVSFNSLSSGQVLAYDGINWVNATASAAGEANTASNIGTGSGIFANKVGVDLKFKSLIEGSHIDLSTSSTEITINVNDVAFAKCATGNVFTAGNNFTGGLCLNGATVSVVGHTHTIANITGLQTCLDSKSNTGHTHTIDNITNLQSSLDAKLNSSSYTAADVLSKLLTVDTNTSTLNSQYLQGCIPSCFAAASHTHTIANVTSLQTCLDGKLNSSSYTAADVLSKLLTVDGSGSGLDADTLDGIQATAFARCTTANVFTAGNNFTGGLCSSGNVVLTTASNFDSLNNVILTTPSSGQILCYNGINWVNGTTGTNASTLDGLDSTEFARCTIANTFTQINTFNNTITVGKNLALPNIAFGDSTNNRLLIRDCNALLWRHDGTNDGTLWHSLNDGTGSGLDADLLDGLHASAFAPASHTHTIANVIGLQTALDAKLNITGYTASDVLTKLLTVDTNTSGLNSQYLQGCIPSCFAAASHTHTISEVTSLQTALDAKLPSTCDAIYGKKGTANTWTLGNNFTGGLCSNGSVVSVIGHTHIISDVTNLSTCLGSKLDSSSYTAADVLTKLLTVDTNTSGLNSQYLQGCIPSCFAAASHTHTIANVTSLQTCLDAKLPSTCDAIYGKKGTANTWTLGNNFTGGLCSNGSVVSVIGHTHTIANITSLQTCLDSKLPSTCDAIYGKLNTSNIFTGNQTISTTGANAVLTVCSPDTHLSCISVLGASQGTGIVYVGQSTTHGGGMMYNGDDAPDVIGTSDNVSFFRRASGIDHEVFRYLYNSNDVHFNGDVISNGFNVLTTNSIINANTLQGCVPANFAAASHTHTIANITNLQSSLDAKLNSSSYTAADVLTKLLTVDTNTSGLNADTLDGIQGSAFARCTIANTFTATNTFTANTCFANIGINGSAPVAQSTGWSVSNLITRKVLDANNTSLDELADIVGTIVSYLLSRGDFGA